MRVPLFYFSSPKSIEKLSISGRRETEDAEGEGSRGGERNRLQREDLDNI